MLLGRSSPQWLEQRMTVCRKGAGRAEMAWGAHLNTTPKVRS